MCGFDCPHVRNIATNKAFFYARQKMKNDTIETQTSYSVIRKNFKDEYLTNAFFFVDSEEQFNTLQDIAVEFGLKNPAGNTERIAYDMHDVSINIAPVRGVNVAKNLAFFPNNRFQKCDFWVRNASYGSPKDFHKFMTHYKMLTELQ